MAEHQDKGIPVEAFLVGGHMAGHSEVTWAAVAPEVEQLVAAAPRNTVSLQPTQAGELCRSA